MGERIYALLDADFIIKTIISKKTDGCHLLDRIISDNSYMFVCHEITLKEVSVHDRFGAAEWLTKAIEDDRIKLYSDYQIIEILCSHYGNSGIHFFRDFLRKSCDAMSSELYPRHYRKVEDYNPEKGESEFISLVSECDCEVERGSSLGEIKLMILARMMLYFHPGKVYLFYSDDRKARAGMFAVAGIPCKSVMSIFWDLYKEGVSRKEAEDYFLPFKDYLTGNGLYSGNIRVCNTDRTCLLKIPCQQVFDEIFEGKFDSMMDGMLRYL